MLLALIGFGEVGQTFGRTLAARNDVQVAAYDLLFDRSDTRAARRAGAAALNVRAAADAADAARDARVVISAVTAAAAGEVARAAAAYLRPGQILLDVNSASPGTKKAAAKAVEAAGAHYVEGAVMAAVSGPGLAVPILAGGPAAEAAATLLNGLGMNLTPVAAEHGRASATKLARSIVMKGIEAILLESRTAARHWGVEDDVMTSLQRTYPGIDWVKLADSCAERVATHGVRRAQELREAAEMMAELGGDPGLCRAIAGVQDRGAKR